MTLYKRVTNQQTGQRETVPMTAEEEAAVLAERQALATEENRKVNRTNDEVAEEDFDLDLTTMHPVTRAALEVLANNAGYTPATLRDAVKSRLIAANFYK